MSEYIEVRPAGEAGLVPVSSRVADEVLMELECQAIEVDWVYRNALAATRGVGLETYLGIERDFDSQGFKGECVVLKARAVASDVAALHRQVYDDHPEAAEAFCTWREADPATRALSQVDWFSGLAHEYRQAREDGNEKWIQEVELNLLKLWPEILDLVNEGMEYSCEKGDIASNMTLAMERSNIVRFMADYGWISETEADEIGCPDARELFWGESEESDWVR